PFDSNSLDNYWIGKTGEYTNNIGKQELYTGSGSNITNPRTLTFAGGTGGRILMNGTEHLIFAYCHTPNAYTKKIMGLYRVIGNGTNTPLPTVTSNDKLTISLYATQMESKSGSVQLWVLDENFNDIDWSGNIMTFPEMKKLTVEISGNNLNSTQKYYIAVLMEVKDANYIWANRTQPRMELANFKIELEKLSYTQEEVSDTK